MNTVKNGLEFNRIGYVGKFLFFAGLLVFSACQKNSPQSSNANAPTALRDVPALRLNFRFESDVPAPVVNQPQQSDERNAAVQNDFDGARAEEILDKTLTAPDKQRVLAVYHRTGDLPSDFRLDLYSADGKLQRKITYEGMAARFPDTILWSPDSSSIAFVAVVRTNSGTAAPTPQAENQTGANQNQDVNANADANANANAAPATPNIEAPKPVLTFRTEQIYLCNRDGADVKPITQNEGLIYFYFRWSPDSSALVALAAMYQEWNYLQQRAEMNGEFFTPQGRPRVVEKNGRERRLDDNLTAVRPVWSPDSAKVAAAFDTQIRIYDAIGDQPTQAAIPLKNQLLISSKTFDDNLRRQMENGNANAAPAANANQEATTLPDENSLVSFNPIINLEWTADDLLYAQTGYIKLMKNETDSARSYLRWHRLVFSPQPGTTEK